MPGPEALLRESSHALSSPRPSRYRAIAFRKTAVLRALRQHGSLSARDLERSCKVPAAERGLFNAFLRDLVRRGELAWRNGYVLPAAQAAQSRKLREHQPLDGILLRVGGAAWVLPDSGGEPLAIPSRAVANFLSGDRVRIPHPEAGHVVLTRRTAAVLPGVTRMARRRVYVEVEGGVRVLLERASEQPPGDRRVRVRLTRFPGAATAGPEPVWGVVEEVLGQAGDPTVERRHARLAFGLSDLPVEPLIGRIRLSRADLEGRVDLRARPQVQAAPGLWLSADEEGVQVVVRVSVADVAHYVPQGTAEDRAAALLGASDALLPALDSAPLAVTVEMRVGPDGQLSRARIYESVLDPAHARPCVLLAEADQRLCRARYGRGGANLDLGHGRIGAGVECVSEANRVVGAWLRDHAVPAIFRVQREGQRAPRHAVSAGWHSDIACDAYAWLHCPLHSYSSVIVHQSLKAAFTGAAPPRDTAVLESEAARLTVLEWKVRQLQVAEERL